MAVLELKGIVFEAGGKRVLDGLDMEIEKGEVHALLGTNGAGKSTVASVIMGCGGAVPKSGDVVFRGARINGLGVYERARLGIAMAWQEPVRFEGIRVRDYLSLRPGGQDPVRCLSLAGLSPERYLDRFVDRCLSGGQRKRVELASVLSLSPSLAVLDEPDSGIDMLSTADIINVIESFRAGGSTVLLITHRQEVAMIADRASHLCAGRIINCGRPADVAREYVSRKCLACAPMECGYARA